MPSLTADAATTLTRMLGRLSPSLWDIDPTSDTLQRDLYRAFAEQMAVWLENRRIASQMTLLLQAQGTDLDVLLQDYGLKRYLQRPDAYARQVGLHILFHPQGTLDCVRILADLLVEQAHVTLRTGRSEQTIFIADTHPITTPYSYWGLVSTQGFWYAVTVDAGLPTISQAPPPGLNVAPGPHTLSWFTVPDDLAQVWYVTIHADTLAISQVQPQGYGSLAVFEVQDGQGTRWHLQVASQEQALMPIAVSSGNPAFTLLNPGHAFEALQLWTSAGHMWWLSVQAHTPTLTSTQPPGSVNVTPAGGPYGWLRLYDLQGALWYAYPVTGGVLTVSLTSPGGRGTAVPQALGDAAGVEWHFGVTPTGQFGLSSAPNVTAQGFATTLCLNDASGARWFWRVRGGRLDWSPVLWPDSLDQSPWGELSWALVPVPNGAIYAYPSRTGAPTGDVAPPFTSYWGWSQPIFFLDAAGAQWQLTAVQLQPGHPDYWQLVDRAGRLWYLWIDAEMATLSATPPAGGADYTPGGQPLAWFVALDAQWRRVYVRVDAEVLVTDSQIPPGVGFDTPAVLADALARFWTIILEARSQNLVTILVRQTGYSIEGPALLTAAPALAPDTSASVTPLAEAVPSTADYWALNDAQGTPYALWIDAAGVPTVTTPVSGGRPTTPPGGPFTWIQVVDESQTPWFVQVQADTLVVVATQPQAAGTTTAVRLSDQAGTVWTLMVSRGEEALVSVVPPPPSLPPPAIIAANAQYWRLVDDASTVWGLWIDAEVPTLTSPITSGHDATPGGTSAPPLPWFVAHDSARQVWYVQVRGDALEAVQTQPAGTGSLQDVTLNDAAGQAWTLSLDQGSEALIASLPGQLQPPGVLPATAQYWRLVDDTSTVWALWMDAEVPTLTTPIVGGTDVTPSTSGGASGAGAAALAWFAASDQAHTPWYLQVRGATLEAVLSQPAGTGTLQAAVLTDAAGRTWTLSMDSGSTALLASLPVPPPSGGGPPSGGPVPGTASYWRMLDTAGTLYAVFVDAEVPTITATVSGGTDQTPGGTPVHWFTVTDEVSTLWYVTIVADSLNLQLALPAGAGTYQVPSFTDTHGTVWTLTAYHTGEALVTTVGAPPGGGAPLAGTWRITVQPVPSSAQIPALAHPLALRDATEAFRHVQAAGSLVSILVS